MSVTPHSIRLNGPWNVYFTPGTEATRVQLPRDWSTIPLQSRDADCKLTRAFHPPTGINPGDDVMLVLDELPISGMISLNGKPLGSFARSERFSITDQLLLRNEIEIVGVLLESGQQAGEVRLEIFAH